MSSEKAAYKASDKLLIKLLVKLLIKLLLQVPRERVARCAGLGAGCGGKCHVDGVYIILSVRTAGGRQSAWSCPGLRRPPRRRRRLPDPAAFAGRGLQRQAPCRRRLHNPQRPQGVASVGHAAKRGVAKARRSAAQTRAG